MKYLATFLLAALALASCKKEETQKPDEVKLRTVVFYKGFGCPSTITYSDPEGQLHTVQTLLDTSFTQHVKPGTRLYFACDCEAYGDSHIAMAVDSDLYAIDYNTPFLIDTILR